MTTQGLGNVLPGNSASVSREMGSMVRAQIRSGITGHQFGSTMDLCEFSESETIEQSMILMTPLKNIIKMYGSSRRCYIYDGEKRIWEDTKEEEFIFFIQRWFGTTIQNIKILLNGLKDQRITNILKQLSKSSYINDILNRTRGMLMDEQFVTQLDSNSNFLPLKDGRKIDLRTLEISERTITDCFTFECPVEYVENTPHADKFFADLFPDEQTREYARLLLGYMLTGDNKGRCFFVFYGHGSNGKSLLMSLMNKIMGKFYHQCSVEVFSDNGKVGGPTPHLFSLMNKRLGVYSEGETADKMNMNISCIKQISGDDKISARGLYRDPIEFYSYVKLVMLSNFVPPLTAEKAIKDRLRYLFFDQIFDENPKQGEMKSDKDFAEKLQNEYLNEVFSWIALGCVRYYTNRCITMPPNEQRRTYELLSGEDSIETFLTRFIKMTDSTGDYIKRSELFEQYQSFCNENSQRCQPRSTLFQRLSHKGLEKSTLHGYDIYRKIKCTFGLSSITEDATDYKALFHEEQKRRIKAEHENQKLKLEIKKLEDQKLREMDMYVKNITLQEHIIKQYEEARMDDAMNEYRDTLAQNILSMSQVVEIEKIPEPDDTQPQEDIQSFERESPKIETISQKVTKQMRTKSRFIILPDMENDDQEIDHQIFSENIFSGQPEIQETNKKEEAKKIQKNPKSRPKTRTQTKQKNARACRENIEPPCGNIRMIEPEQLSQKRADFLDSLVDSI